MAEPQPSTSSRDSPNPSTSRDSPHPSTSSQEPHPSTSSYPHPTSHTNEDLPDVFFVENSQDSFVERKKRRPRKDQASNSKSKLAPIACKTTRKSHHKLLGSWSEKTQAYIKMVTGGKAMPWSLGEKKALLAGLKKYSHQDWDSLCKMVPTRSKEEIERYIYNIKGGVTFKPKAPQELHLNWLPIESWLDMGQEMVHYEQTDLSSLLSRVFSMMGNFSKFPEVVNSDVQPDYGKLYRYIAAVLDESLSLPDLTPLESCVMVDLMHGLGDQLRASDTTLQRKVMCWKYKMLSHRFDFSNVGGSIDRIRMALTNDFSDLQKGSKRPTEVVSNFDGSTSQSGDSDANAARNTEPSPSTSTQGNGDRPAQPAVQSPCDVASTEDDGIAKEEDGTPKKKRPGRPPRFANPESRRPLEKPKLYSMNPFCVPIRLLRFKPLVTPRPGEAGASSQRPRTNSVASSRASVASSETSMEKTPRRNVPIETISNQQIEQNEIRQAAGLYMPAVPRRCVPKTMAVASDVRQASGSTLQSIRSAISKQRNYSGGAAVVKRGYISKSAKRDNQGASSQPLTATGWQAKQQRTSQARRNISQSASPSANFTQSAMSSSQSAMNSTMNSQLSSPATNFTQSASPSATVRPSTNSSQSAMSSTNFSQSSMPSSQIGRLLTSPALVPFHSSAKASSSSIAPPFPNVPQQNFALSSPARSTATTPGARTSLALLQQDFDLSSAARSTTTTPGARTSAATPFLNVSRQDFALPSSGRLTSAGVQSPWSTTPLSPALSSVSASSYPLSASPGPLSPPPSVGSASRARSVSSDSNSDSLPKPLRAFRCVHLPDGRMALVPASMDKEKAIAAAATTSSSVASESASDVSRSASDLSRSASDVSKSVSSSRFSSSSFEVPFPSGIKPENASNALNAHLQASAGQKLMLPPSTYPRGRKLSSGLTVSSSLFKSPLRAPVVGCAVSCGTDDIIDIEPFDSDDDDDEEESVSFEYIYPKTQVLKRLSSAPAGEVTAQTKRPRFTSEDGGSLRQETSFATQSEREDRTQRPRFEDDVGESAKQKISSTDTSLSSREESQRSAIILPQIIPKKRGRQFMSGNASSSSGASLERELAAKRKVGENAKASQRTEVRVGRNATVVSVTQQQTESAVGRNATVGSVSQQHTQGAVGHNTPVGSVGQRIESASHHNTTRPIVSQHTGLLVGHNTSIPSGSHRPQCDMAPVVLPQIIPKNRGRPPKTDGPPKKKKKTTSQIDVSNAEQPVIQPTVNKPHVDEKLLREKLQSYLETAMDTQHVAENTNTASGSSASEVPTTSQKNFLETAMESHLAGKTKTATQSVSETPTTQKNFLETAMESHLAGKTKAGIIEATAQKKPRRGRPPGLNASTPKLPKLPRGRRPGSSSKNRKSSDSSNSRRSSVDSVDCTGIFVESPGFSGYSVEKRKSSDNGSDIRHSSVDGISAGTSVQSAGIISVESAGVSSLNNLPPKPSAEKPTNAGDCNSKSSSQHQTTGSRKKRSSSAGPSSKKRVGGQGDLNVQESVVACPDLLTPNTAHPANSAHIVEGKKTLNQKPNLPSSVSSSVQPCELSSAGRGFAVDSATTRPTVIKTTNARPVTTHTSSNASQQIQNTARSNSVEKTSRSNSTDESRASSTEKFSRSNSTEKSSRSNSTEQFSRSNSTEKTSRSNSTDKSYRSNSTEKSSRSNSIEKATSHNAPATTNYSQQECSSGTRPRARSVEQNSRQSFSSGDSVASDDVSQVSHAVVIRRYSTSRTRVADWSVKTEQQEERENEEERGTAALSSNVEQAENYSSATSSQPAQKANSRPTQNALSGVERRSTHDSSQLSSSGMAASKTSQGLSSSKITTPRTQANSSQDAQSSSGSHGSMGKGPSSVARTGSSQDGQPSSGNHSSKGQGPSSVSRTVSSSQDAQPSSKNHSSQGQPSKFKTTLTHLTTPTPVSVPSHTPLTTFSSAATHVEPNPEERYPESDGRRRKKGGEPAGRDKSQRKHVAPRKYSDVDLTASMAEKVPETSTGERTSNSGTSASVFTQQGKESEKKKKRLQLETADLSEFQVEYVTLDDARKRALKSAKGATHRDATRQTTSEKLKLDKDEVSLVTL